MFQPHRAKPNNGSSAIAMTTMAKGGVNLKDLPEFLNPAFATVCENYFIQNNAGLSKRKGLIKLKEIAGSKPGTLHKYWKGYQVFGYDKTVAIYDEASDTVTNIKTNWNTSAAFTGAPYGDYFLVGNTGNNINYISQVLTYGTQTANFTVGATLTGATSGAKATILSDADGGATGTLTLGLISGTFASGEIISDDNTVPGSATSTSLLTFAITEIATAPKSGVIAAIGARLYAGVGTAVFYCDVDAGTNPPFNSWTIAETATAGGKVSFRNAGTVNSIVGLGDVIVAFGDTGKYAFRLVIQPDGTGTVVKVEQIVIDRVDMGGASGAIMTPKGVFYVNSAGLWQLMSLGQPNIAYSDQEQLTSVNLGTDYFKGIDLTNCDLAYYARYSTVLITCAKASTQNNHVIAFNPDMRAFSTFRNWNIGRWLTNDSEIYAISSVKTALYHCFAGNSDDGANISVNYLQELKLQSGSGSKMRPVPLWTRQMFYGGYAKGFLSTGSVVNVAFDIYNVRGKLEKNKLQFYFTPQYNDDKSDGWGTAEWGKSEWGGDRDTSGMIESFDGNRKFIRNFQRIRLHITESSKLPHEIDYIQIESKPKSPIRIRKMAYHT